MSEPEENLDDILRERLRARLREGESDVRPSLYCQIHRRLHPSGSRTGWYLLALLFMIVWGVQEAMNGKSAQRKADKKSLHSTRGVGANTLADASPAAEAGPGQTTPQVPSQIHAVASRAALRATQPGSGSVGTISRHADYPRKGSAQNALAAAQNVQVNSVVPDMAVQPAAKPDLEQTSSEPTEREIRLASLEPISGLTADINLKLPAIGIPSVTHTKTAPKDKLRWIGVVNPSQTFQMLAIRRAQGTLYQNIRAVSPWSVKSTGVSLATGVGWKGFQFLGSYAYRRICIDYEKITDEFNVLPNEDGTYTFLRRGTPETYDEKRHELGLGIKRSFTFRRGVFRNYEVLAGSDYRFAPGHNKQQVSLNASLIRPVYTGRQLQFSIGAFGEYGIRQQRAGNMNWYYKPYQIGLSLQVGKIQKP